MRIRWSLSAADSLLKNFPLNRRNAFTGEDTDEWWMRLTGSRPVEHGSQLAKRTKIDGRYTN
jgi:hypothetical protein